MSFVTTAKSARVIKYFPAFHVLISIIWSISLFDFQLIECLDLIFRWKVRVFDGTETAKEGWVLADVLDTQHTEQSIYGDKADDAAYRRE